MARYGNQRTPFEVWHRELQAAMRRRRKGGCVEWTGAYLGTVPVVYCPRGIPWDTHRGQRQSVRSVLWALKHGHQAPAGQVIRPACCNPLCVREAHWLVTDRQHQSRLQSERGESQTARRKAANKRKARATAKLNERLVLQILVSAQPAKVEAARLGVTRSTITAVRRRELWAGPLPGLQVVPSVSVDTRYQVDPRRFEGGEFSRLGIGRYVEAGA